MGYRSGKGEEYSGAGLFFFLPFLEAETDGTEMLWMRRRDDFPPLALVTLFRCSGFPGPAEVACVCNRRAAARRGAAGAMNAGVMTYAD
jgi:hypothetical protein